MYIGLHVKYSLSSTEFQKILISNFMEIHPLGAELFHADRQTDSHDKANSSVSQICEYAEKPIKIYINKAIQTLKTEQVGNNGCISFY
jgi:hypothetical protein